jgi:ATP-dependent Clp protease ATP-binding subunit ClpC
MFERYTEKARRVIFFARYEASQFGSPYIETEHLLLGILREDKSLTNRFLHSHSSVESIRHQIEAHTPVREKIETSVDLPLTNEGKRVLAYAAEEAERLGHKHIGTEHLLLGLLREEKCFAAEILNERGVKLNKIRKDLEKEPPSPTQPGLRSGAITAASNTLSDFTRDLTQAAMDGLLDPLVGREQEMDAVIEVLCSCFRKSPLLIGERGAGKSAIIAGLAQRIVDGAVPADLADKRILALDGQVIASWALLHHSAHERLNQLVRSLIEATNVIFFLDDFHLLIAAITDAASEVAHGIVKHWLLRGRLQCAAACTPDEYQSTLQAAPWIQQCFRPIHVQTLTGAMTLEVLQSRKHVYETFHGVTYADEALEFAAQSHGAFLPQSPLPGKALELLDAAGTLVKLRQGVLPEEIRETMKRIKFIVHRMDSAIQSHEFEKARFYSEEERKERDNLRQLKEKHHLDAASSPVVTRQDIEQVIARSQVYPFGPLHNS